MENKIVTYPNLPLAIYREIVAHLGQVSDVVVEILPQDQAFAYDQSQARGLVIKSTEELPLEQAKLIKDILAHYASIYGAYQLS